MPVQEERPAERAGVPINFEQDVIQRRPVTTQAGLGGEEFPTREGGLADEDNMVFTSVNNLINWARSRSPWPLGYGLACCAIEMIATGASTHDLARFGAEVFRSSPRQADVMIVAGTVTHKMAPRLRRLYEQMPEPKWVIAMGNCASSGGEFWDSYSTLQGVTRSSPSTCTCRDALRVLRRSPRACSGSAKRSRRADSAEHHRHRASPDPRRRRRRASGHRGRRPRDRGADPEFGTAASVDAWRAAFGAAPLRREGRRMHPGDGIPPPRPREDLRVAHLPSGPALRRSVGLRRRDA